MFSLLVWYVCIQGAHQADEGEGAARCTELVPWGALQSCAAEGRSVLCIHWVCSSRIWVTYGIAKPYYYLQGEYVAFGLGTTAPYIDEEIDTRTQVMGPME